MAWKQLAWQWTLAIMIRVVLLALGVGDAMLWRPEVSTPANTVLKAREGVWLLQMGINPYSGSACHLPPLWLALTAPLAQHKVFYAVPNMVCDILSAIALHLASAAVLHRPAGVSNIDAPWLHPGQLSLLYLLNPFTMLTCISGSSTSAENMGVMLAVAGGLMCNAPMAAAGVAVGTYMGLHPLLLVLPVLMLMWRGPEDVLQAVPPPVAPLLLPSRKPRRSAMQCLGLMLGMKTEPGATSNNNNSNRAQEDLDAAADSASGSVQASASSKETRGAKLRYRGKASASALTQLQPAVTTTTVQFGIKQQQQQREQLMQPSKQHTAAQGSRSVQQRLRCMLCWVFIAGVLGVLAAFLLLSDIMLQPYPETQCLPAMLQWVQQAVGFEHAGRQHVKLSSCWAVKVYALSLQLQDYTPTIGLWWYFFTEMFDAFRPFFLFVFHSFDMILSVPVAIRFAHRPLFVAWLQMFITCMFKPYACVGDMVPWMAWLPLLQQQLQCVKLGLFFVNSMLLLMVLGPAMWHQWIIVDAANSNFFYSITLLLGVWYTVFLVHMMRITALLDSQIAGKRLLIYADELEHKTAVAAVVADSLQEKKPACVNSHD